MFKIISKLNGIKKVYHLLKEIGVKGGYVLFIFEDKEHLNVCKDILDYLEEKFPKIKFKFSFKRKFNSRTPIDVISESDINSSLKNRFDVVFDLPYMYDTYIANKDYFGTPIKIQESQTNDICSYYSFKKYITLQINEEIVEEDSILLAQMIDKLLNVEKINTVLVGNPCSIALVHHHSTTNPIVIFNNNLLSDELSKKSFLVIKSEDIEDELSIFNMIKKIES